MHRCSGFWEWQRARRLLWAFPPGGRREWRKGAGLYAPPAHIRTRLHPAPSPPMGSPLPFLDGSPCSWGIPKKPPSVPLTHAARTWPGPLHPSKAGTAPPSESWRLSAPPVTAPASNTAAARCRLARRGVYEKAPTKSRGSQYAGGNMRYASTTDRCVSTTSCLAPV